MMMMLWKRRLASACALCTCILCIVTPSNAFVTPSKLELLRGARRQASPSSDTSPEECSINDEDAAACLSSAGYVQQQESFMSISQVFIAQVESLRDSHPSFEDSSSNGSNVIKFHKRNKRGKHHLHCKDDDGCQDGNTHVANMEYNTLVGQDDVVLVDVVRKQGMASVSRAFPAAGPRKFLHFDPSTVNAAIVTCGGLCPGLNNVIRELVHSLYYLYGAQKVYGVVGGFNGFRGDNPDYDPVVLTNELVENIHHEGGTVLRSSRGGFDIDKIIDFLTSRDISQLYIIGGDGSHRGAYAIHQACQERNLNIAVAGVPKTIDNDVDYIDRSFGFQSAVEAAQHAIHTAKTEAMCTVPNGIGVVKMMGRSAGFLAAFAALGSGDVDLVLVPEVSIVLDGPDGILPFVRQRIKEQGYVVVVLAEGAGEELVGISDEVDAGGNKAKPEIAPFLVEKVKDYFADYDETTSMKYIDPSYTVRSVPANGADSLYCTQLAQNAVHGAMAGLTGFSVGVINKCDVYLPIPQLVATSPRSMDPYGTTWERVLAMTGQPNSTPTVNKQVEEEAEFPKLMEPTVH